MTGQEKAPTGVRAKDIRERNSTAKRRLPAYARKLRELIASGKNPRHGIAVFVDRAPVHGICKPLAVFPDADPAALDWSICAGLDVTVPFADEVDRDRLQSTVRAIKAAKPRRLMLLKAAPPGFEFVVLGEAP